LLNYLIIIGYFVLLLVLGAWSQRKVKSAEDAVIAGKSLTLFTTSIGRAATTLSGTATVGSASYGFTMGISGLWFNISTFLLNIGFAPLAGRVKAIADKYSFTTLGDFLEYRFGKTAKTICGVMNLITYVGFGVSQIIATGAIIFALTGLDLMSAMIGSTVVIIIYTIMGGMHAIIITDIMQLAIMYIGIVLLAFPMGLNHMGGWSGFWVKVPDVMRDFGAMGIPAIVAMVLTNLLGAFVVQVNYLFTISAKDQKIATRSNFVAAIMYVIPAGLCLLIGVMAFILFPDVSPNNALGAFMTHVLPDGASGMLMAAIIAATMSSSSAFAMAGSMCFVNDIYKQYVNPHADDKKTLLVTRITLAVDIVICLIISMFFQDIISIVLWAFAFACGALLAPTLACLYWKRATKVGALLSMFVGGSLHLFFTIFGSSIPVFFISVPVSTVLMITGSLLSKPQKMELVEEFFNQC
jgi:SSS family solute:Na+ symporter